MTKKFADFVDGVELTGASAGDVSSATSRDAQMLVTDGWDAPLAPGEVDSLAAERQSFSPAGAADVHSPLPSTLPSADDWELALSSRANAIVIGSPDQTRHLVEMAAVRLRQPIVSIDAAKLKTLPDPRRIGTLVVHNLPTLSSTHQQRLFHWLDDASGVQVVSTAPHSIVPLIQKSTFLEALYYRLNVIHVAAIGAADADA